MIAEVAAEKLVNVDVIAELLGCSADTVIRRCEHDGLPHRKIGKRRQFLLSEVVAWIASQRIVKHAGPEAHPPGRGPGPSAKAAPSDLDAEIKALRFKKGKP